MNFSGAAQIAAGAVLFGLIPLFVTYCGEFPVTGIALGRALFAALTGAVLMKMQKKNFALQKKLLLHYFIWTLFLLSAILFYFMAIRAAGQALPGAVLGIHPLFVVLFVRIFFSEKIQLLTLIACVMAVPGVLLMAGPLQGSQFALSGIIFSLLSAMMLGLNFTYHLRFLKDEPAERMVFYQNLFQVPMLLLLLPFDEGDFSVQGIFPLMMLGVFCTGIAYMLIYKGSQRVSKQKIGLLQVIENVIPVLTGVFFFHEQISGAAFTGIVLILFAVTVPVLVKEKKA